MLSLSQIGAVAADGAAAFLPPGALVRAESRFCEGMDSNDQLLVMMVIGNTEFPHITGQHALELVDQIQQRLQADDEDRFTTVGSRPTRSWPPTAVLDPDGLFEQAETVEQWANRNCTSSARAW